MVSFRKHDTRLIIRRKLNGTTTWYSPNWKPRIATVDSCFDLVGSRQHVVASNDVISWSAHHPLNADGDDLRWNSNPNFCRLANVTCKTRDKGQQEKTRISCHCRHKETADRQAQTGHNFRLASPTFPKVVLLTRRTTIIIWGPLWFGWIQHTNKFMYGSSKCWCKFSFDKNSEPEERHEMKSKKTQIPVN